MLDPTEIDDVAGLSERALPVSTLGISAREGARSSSPLLFSDAGTRKRQPFLAGPARCEYGIRRSPIAPSRAIPAQYCYWNALCDLRLERRPDQQ